MLTRARILGHSVHQAIVHLPLGALIVATALDIFHQFRPNETAAMAASWLIAIGVVSGLVAAVFGLIDWTGIPSNTRAKRVGTLHGLGNVVVVGLYAMSLLLRWDTQAYPPQSAILLSIVGLLCAVVTAWLGGELVSRLGVGVHPGANIDAPSSLHPDEPVLPSRR
jgi:uncharacterized membrane protein